MHTYCVSYARELCTKHKIPFIEKTPLHSLFGGYIKFLVNSKLIESDMTNTILRNSNSIFNDYNHVRNKQSYAHDNKILNYNESLLIYRNITSLLNFIKSVEDSISSVSTQFHKP